MQIRVWLHPLADGEIPVRQSAIHRFQVLRGIEREPEQILVAPPLVEAERIGRIYKAQGHGKGLVLRPVVDGLYSAQRAMILPNGHIRSGEVPLRMQSDRVVPRVGQAVDPEIAHACFRLSPRFTFPNVFAIVYLSGGKYNHSYNRLRFFSRPMPPDSAYSRREGAEPPSWSQVMKFLVFIPLFLFASNLYAELRHDEFSTLDYVLMGTAQILILIDRHQTLEFTSEGTSERNPLLGPHPSKDRINIGIAISSIFNFAITYYLPKEYRPLFLFTIITFELDAVENNHRKGNPRKLVVGYSHKF